MWGLGAWGCRGSLLLSLSPSDRPDHEADRALLMRRPPNPLVPGGARNIPASIG